MGKFTFDVPSDLIKQIESLGEHAEEIALAMIDGAIPILEGNIKDELDKHRRTGSLVNSVKRTKAGKSKIGGYYAVVRPTGVDLKGVRNMEKLAHAEYGTKNQPGTPILTKALKDSEKEVHEKMQDIFNWEARD